MKRTVTKIFAALFLSLALTSFISCEKKTEAQKTQEKIEKELKAASKDLEAGLKKAGNAIEDGAKEAQKELRKLFN